MKIPRKNKKTGICIYYSEKDGIACCQIVEKSKTFRKLLLDRCKTKHCPKERYEKSKRM